MLEGCATSFYLYGLEMTMHSIERSVVVVALASRTGIVVVNRIVLEGTVATIGYGDIVDASTRNQFSL
jgi:hypothetical protein